MFTKAFKTQKRKTLLILAFVLLAAVIVSTAVFPSKPKEASAWWSDPAGLVGVATHNYDSDVSTHQILARSAYAYVRPMFPNVFPAPNNNGGTTITRYADWPRNVPHISLVLLD